MEIPEFTKEEKIIFDSLKKPKYSIKDYENYCIKKGFNPYAPWMKEDHERIEKILNKG